MARADDDEAMKVSQRYGSGRGGVEIHKISLRPPQPRYFGATRSAPSDRRRRHEKGEGFQRSRGSKDC